MVRTKWSDKVVRTVPCAALIQETPLPHRGLCGPLSRTSPAHCAALSQEARLPHPSSTRRRRRSGSAALIQEAPLPHRGLCGPLTPTSPAFLRAVKIRPADAAEHHGRLPLRVALLPRDQGQRFSADIADRFSRWTGRCSPPHGFVERKARYSGVSRRFWFRLYGAKGLAEEPGSWHRRDRGIPRRGVDLSVTMPWAK